MEDFTRKLEALEQECAKQRAMIGTLLVAMRVVAVEPSGLQESYLTELLDKDPEAVILEKQAREKIYEKPDTYYFNAYRVRSKGKSKTS